MNQLQAFRDTIALAKSTDKPKLTQVQSLSMQHLEEMLVTIEAEAWRGYSFSPSKLGRWLGWAQAAIVSWGHHTLEEMKEINMKNKEDANVD